MGKTEEYIGETGCLKKERLNIYRQHIRQRQYQQLAAEEQIRTFGDEKFYVSFFQDFSRE